MLTPRRVVRLLVLSLIVLAPTVGPSARAIADDETPAVERTDLFEVGDRKKTMSMKLPRSWKAIGENDKGNPSSLVEYGGFFGEPDKSDNGFVGLFVNDSFARAQMARAVEMPRAGEVKPGSNRQGPGWSEGCAITENKQALWRRYVEKNGHVYMFQIIAHQAAYDRVKPVVEKFLDTAIVPGELSPPALGAGSREKKVGDFDVATDAEADREKSVTKAVELLTTSRELVAKILPGKPYVTSRPTAWIYQNGTKFEERGKAALGVAVQFACYNPKERCSMVSILGEKAQGYDQRVFDAAASQYAWQFFGGEIPIWLDTGLQQYGRVMGLSGGKGKLLPELVTNVKQAVAAGKRRLDQWFGVASWNEVTDSTQASNELFGWIWYFRLGPGARKYKKQFDGYLLSLRETGDPAQARKSFEGVNFDELLQDFKTAIAEMR